MRRADRLFQITLLLGRGKVLTGNTLAVRLGVQGARCIATFRTLRFRAYQLKARPAPASVCAAVFRCRH